MGVTRNRQFFKSIAVVIVFLFTANQFIWAYPSSLASRSGLREEDTRALLYGSFLRQCVIVARTSEDMALLELNNADALLLSPGKCLVKKEIAMDELMLIRKVIHEEIEALMQILMRYEPGEYGDIKNVILSQSGLKEAYYALFPKNKDLPQDFMLNDIVAYAFELLFITEHHLIDSVSQPEEVFLNSIRDIILSNRHNYFTAEFWNTDERGRRIRTAFDKGMRFYQVASGEGRKRKKEGDLFRVVRTAVLSEILDNERLDSAKRERLRALLDYKDISLKRRVDVVLCDKGVPWNIRKILYELALNGYIEPIGIGLVFPDTDRRLLSPEEIVRDIYEMLNRSGKARVESALQYLKRINQQILERMHEGDFSARDQEIEYPRIAKDILDYVLSISGRISERIDPWGVIFSPEGIGVNRDAFAKAKDIIERSNKSVVYGSRERTDCVRLFPDNMLFWTNAERSFGRAFDFIRKCTTTPDLYNYIRLKLSVVAVSDRTGFSMDEIIAAQQDPTRNSIGNDFFVAEDPYYFSATYFDKEKDTLYISANLLIRLLNDPAKLAVVLAQTGIHDYRDSLNEVLDYEGKEWRLNIGFITDVRRFFYGYFSALMSKTAKPWRTKLAENIYNLDRGDPVCISVISRHIEQGIIFTLSSVERLLKNYLERLKYAEWHNRIFSYEDLVAYLREKGIISEEPRKREEQERVLRYILDNLDGDILFILEHPSLIKWLKEDQLKTVDRMHLRFVIQELGYIYNNITTIPEDALYFYLGILGELSHWGGDLFRMFIEIFRTRDQTITDVELRKILLFAKALGSTGPRVMKRKPRGMSYMMEDESDSIKDFINIVGMDNAILYAEVLGGNGLGNLLCYQIEEFREAVRNYGVEFLLELARITKGHFNSILSPGLDNCKEWITRIGKDEFLNIVRLFGEDFRYLLLKYRPGRAFFLEDIGLTKSDFLFPRLSVLKDALGLCPSNETKKWLLGSISQLAGSLSEDELFFSIPYLAEIYSFTLIQTEDRDGINRLVQGGERDILRFIAALAKENIFPLPKLVRYVSTHYTIIKDGRIDKDVIGILKREMQAIRDGGFNPKNPLHPMVNYCLLRSTLPAFGYEKYLGYKEFEDILKKGIKGEEREGPTVTPREIVELKGMCYEAHLLREYILKVKAQADRLGRELLVISNLSYGQVATSPITEERDGSRYITGTDIKVIGTKIGSTQHHYDKPGDGAFEQDRYDYSNVFPPAILEYIVSKKPIVIVVDASSSVGSADRTNPHIPDAYKGWRNVFMAINYALTGSRQSIDPVGDEYDVYNEIIAKNPSLVRLINRIKGIPKVAESVGYNLRFWYPGQKGLWLRREHTQTMKIAKKLSSGEIDGPILIFAQSAMEPEAVNDLIATAFIGGRHNPAYFDDKDNFRRLLLDYEEGYGVIFSQKYLNLARRYFRQLLTAYSREIQDEESRPVLEETIPINAAILDLDGVLAKTDERLTKDMQDVLISLLRKGKKVVIITEDIERNLEDRIVSLIPNELRNNLWIFSDGGTNGFSFNSQGARYYIEEYNARSRIEDLFRRKVLDILEKGFKGQYEIDNREKRISLQYRIDLRNIRTDRNEFINRLNGILRKNGITAKVYKVGKTSVKIVLQHKEDALRYWISGAGLNEGDLLIVGDSARTHQVDRGLLSRFPQAISVNVGRYSQTISQLNPNIIQLADEGIPAVYKLLSMVEKSGGIGVKRLRSSGGKERGEGEKRGEVTVALLLNGSSASGKGKPNPDSGLSKDVTGNFSKRIHIRGLSEAIDRVGSRIIKEDKEVIIPEEYLKGKGFDFIRMIKGKNRSWDIKIMPMVQAKEIASNLNNANNRIVLLKDEDLDMDTRKHIKCRVMELKNYNFLHLVSAVELARAILAEDRDSIEIFYKFLMHRPLSLEESARLIVPHGIISIELPPIKEDLIKDINTLREEYATLLMSA